MTSLALQSTGKGSHICGGAASLTRTGKEPFLPESLLPGGDIEQGGHVVGGDGGPGLDGDGCAGLKHGTCDNIPGVADTGVVHQASYGIDSSTSVWTISTFTYVYYHLI